MKTLIRAFAIIFLLPAFALAQPALSPGTIMSEIDKTGPYDVAAKIYEDGDAWEKVLANIRSGNTDWLKIAAALRLGTDGGASKELTLAVGEALEHEPDAVLRIAVPVFEYSVCDGPDIDDARYDSYDLSLKAIETRKARLRSVSDTSLTESVKKCIDGLDAAKLGIAIFYGTVTDDK